MELSEHSGETPGPTGTTFAKVRELHRDKPEQWQLVDSLLSPAKCSFFRGRQLVAKMLKRHTDGHLIVRVLRIALDMEQMRRGAIRPTALLFERPPLLGEDFGHVEQL